MQNASFHSFMLLYILYYSIIIIDAYTRRVRVNVVAGWGGAYFIILWTPGLFCFLYWSFYKILFIYQDNLML